MTKYKLGNIFYVLFLGVVFFSAGSSANLTCNSLFNNSKQDAYQIAMEDFRQDFSSRPFQLPVIDIHQYVDLYKSLIQGQQQTNKYDNPFDVLSKFVLKYRDGRVETFFGAVDRITLQNGKLSFNLIENRNSENGRLVEIELNQVLESAVGLIRMRGNLQLKLTRGQIPQPTIHYEAFFAGLGYKNSFDYDKVSDSIRKEFARISKDNPFYFREGFWATRQEPDSLQEIFNLKKDQIVIVSFSNTLPERDSIGYIERVDPGNFFIASGIVIGTTKDEVEIRTPNGEMVTVRKKFIFTLLIHDPSLESRLNATTIAKLSRILDDDKKSKYRMNFSGVYNSLKEGVVKAHQAVTDLTRLLDIKTEFIYSPSGAVSSGRLKKGDQIFIITENGPYGDRFLVVAELIQYLAIIDRQALSGGPFLVGVEYKSGTLIKLPLSKINSLHKVVD